MDTRVIFFLLCLLGAACAGTRPAQVAPAGPPSQEVVGLEQTDDDVDTLVDTFLDALARNDEATLRAISVSREEFDRVVWPQLPSNRPGSNTTPDFVWQQYDMHNQAAFQNLIQSRGGKKYDLVSIEFLEKPKDYGTFTIHRDSVLTVRDGSEGTSRMRMFGSVIEMNGRFKIYGYVTD